MAEASLNLLLVEDDEVDVMTVRRALRSNGLVHPLFVARNGQEALDMLQKGECPRERCLVLLDLNMPRMTGIEFLKKLREDEKLRKTPVVVLTSSRREQDRADAYEHHVAGYAVKPLTFPAFVQLTAVLNAYWTSLEMPPCA